MPKQHSEQDIFRLDGLLSRIIQLLPHDNPNSHPDRSRSCCSPRRAEKFHRKLMKRAESPAGARRRYLVDAVKMIAAQRAVASIYREPGDLELAIASARCACRVWRQSAESHGFRLP